VFTETAELYDAFYAWKDYPAEAERIHAIIGSRIASARTLLDVACGTGAHLEQLRAWYEVEGLDVDAKLLAIASVKLPGVRLHQADMRDFDLGRQFDVVTCLFSSIGYVEDERQLRGAVARMTDHLAPGGVLLVEPWHSREKFDPHHIGRALFVDQPDLQAVRLNGSRVEGDRSIFDFHYLVATPGKVEHRTETHSLGLFSDAQYRQALELAGLETEHDAEGLMGRGLWIGRRSLTTT
jgi:SAM-dependent methyltransferase